MFLAQNFQNIESIPLSLEFYGGASYTVSDPKDFFKKLKITSPTTILLVWIGLDNGHLKPKQA